MSLPVAHHMDFVTIWLAVCLFETKFELTKLIELAGSMKKRLVLVDNLLFPYLPFAGH